MNELFTATLTAQELQAGINQYYFSVQEEDADAGQVVTNYKQEQGAIVPFALQMEDINQVKARVLADLNQRIKHIPAKEALESEELTIQTTIKTAKPDTEVMVYYRKPGAKIFRMLSAEKQAGGKNEQLYLAHIPKADIFGGYNQYYIQVIENHPSLGQLVVTLPPSGDVQPYIYTIRKLQDVVLKGIQFTNLQNIEEGKQANVRIFFQHLPDDMKVSFKYRVAGDTTSYLTTDMLRQGNHFDSEISQSFIKAGNLLEYYFEITLPEARLTLKYPDANLLPLSFKILTVDKGKPEDTGVKDNGGKEPKDKDKEQENGKNKKN
jgi:hypothetical protein